MLKHSGQLAALGGAGVTVGTASADDQRLQLATRPFVEVKMEYRGASDHATGVGCGGLKYLTHDGLATLVNYDAWPGNPPDVLVGHRGDLHGPAHLQRDIETRFLTAEGTFQGHSTRALRLTESHGPERPTVARAGRGVRVEYGGESATLSGNERVEIPLDPVEVSVRPRPTETREVTVDARNGSGPVQKTRSVEPDPVSVDVEPVLTARSHGPTTFFGGEGQAVVPRASDHVLAKHVRSQAPRTNQGDELVVASGGDAR